MLAESGAYQAVYLNDLTIFYLRCRFACNSLPLRNLRLLRICADLLLPAKAALLGLAAICALSIAGDYTAPKQDSRAAADNRSRGKSYSNAKRGFAARRQSIRQALQLFELLACNGKRLSFGRATPVFFLGKENGGRITRHLCRIDIRTCAKKEEFSFEKENIPLSRIPCTVQGKNPSPLKGYHLLPVNKKSAPRFSKTARNIRFANPSPHA